MLDITMGTYTQNILPSADILNEYEEGKFVLTNLAAKRAKQIRNGAPPLVRIDSSHSLSIALAEIAEGKIRPITTEEAMEAAGLDYEDHFQGIAEMDEGLNLLLPALDDSEEALFDQSSLLEEEDDVLDIGDESALDELEGLGDNAEDMDDELSGSHKDIISVSDLEELEAEESMDDFNENE